jgi:type II secretory pathway pseudopilin PulG
MKARPARGMSLVETLMVVAISAIVVGGAATYFRTIQQVYAQAEQRREALQLARGILDHIVRHIRAASLVTDISKFTDNDSKLEYRDASGVKCTYQLSLSEGKFTYAVEGLLSFTLIKDNTRLKNVDFKAYDLDGNVTTVTDDVAAVESFVTVAIPNTAQTLNASTLVWLRNASLSKNQVRQAQCYASTYATIAGSGLTNSSAGLGAPDDTFATISQASGTNTGSYSGYSQSRYTGTIYSIAAGIRLRYRSGSVRVYIYRNTSSLLSVTYTAEDLESFVDSAGWMWVDVTPKRASWSDTDIPLLKVYVSDGGTAADFDCDSIAIRAFFDAPATDTYWADRQGDGVVPNQWTSPNLAYAAPDKLYAVGYFPSYQTQSFRTTVTPPANHEIISVDAALQLYVSSDYYNDTLTLRALLPTDGALKSPSHTINSATLSAYVKADHCGLLFVDLTRDRVWTWDDLNTREIRLKCNWWWYDNASIYVDAVGWRVLHAPPMARGIESWSVK